MSIILDALRKSESERQQTAGPSIADTRVAPTGKSNSFWIPALASLLIANFVLMAAFWIGNNFGSTESSTAAIVEPEKAIEKVSPPVPRRAPLEKKSAAPTLQAAAATAPARSPPPATVPAVSSPATRAVRKSPTEIDYLPSYEAMVLEGRISGVPLHLDIHVYSDKSDERFVFINMEKYREGDQLSEGPVVKKITEQGVIVDNNGDQFLLSRQ
jgi:general secretion pathway protein B